MAAPVKKDINLGLGKDSNPLCSSCGEIKATSLKRKTKNIMKYDWQKIKAEYVESQITLEELSKKYGCSFGYIQQKAASDKWQDERKKYLRRIEDKTQKKKLIR